jgi:hypothetical protein
MPVTLSSEVYRREAKRLYDMAEAVPLGQVRNEFLDLARQYEALARHAEAQERRTTTDLPDAPGLIARIGLVPER